jgi:hypothetical protein
MVRMTKMDIDLARRINMLEKAEFCALLEFIQPVRAKNVQRCAADSGASATRTKEARSS